MHDLIANREILVVGGSSGMGLATARQCLAQNGRVKIVGRNRDRLDSAIAYLGGPDERIVSIQADASTEEGRAKIFAGVRSIDHMVVTSANLSYKPLAQFDLNSVRLALASKIEAPFFLSQSAAPMLAKDGSITFVSGIAAYRPIPGGSITATVNGALEAMVRALCQELAPVRVNAVSPGWIDTPIWSTIISDDQKAAAHAAMAERIPARRIGQAEDVAAAIVSIMENPHISGTVLHVDGGQQLV